MKLESTVREPSIEEMVAGITECIKDVKSGESERRMLRMINLSGVEDLTITFFKHPFPGKNHKQFERVWKKDLLRLIKTGYPIMGDAAMDVLIETIQVDGLDDKGRFYRYRGAIYIVGEKYMCMFFMDSASNRDAEMKASIAAAMVTH